MKAVELLEQLVDQISTGGNIDIWYADKDETQKHFLEHYFWTKNITKIEGHFENRTEYLGVCSDNRFGIKIKGTPDMIVEDKLFPVTYLYKVEDK